MIDNKIAVTTVQKYFFSQTTLTLTLTSLRQTNHPFHLRGACIPSARNSGLLSTWKVCEEADDSTLFTASAVRTGTVDFSTYT